MLEPDVAAREAARLGLPKMPSLLIGVDSMICAGFEMGVIICVRVGDGTITTMPTRHASRVVKRPHRD